MPYRPLPAAIGFSSSPGLALGSVGQSPSNRWQVGRRDRSLADWQLHSAPKLAQNALLTCNGSCSMMQNVPDMSRAPCMSARPTGRTLQRC